MRRDPFSHEALLYAGPDEFVAGATGFIRTAMAADQPVLVMVPGERVDRLRAELGDDARHVRFADMTSVGRNPGRIIASWRGFVAEHGTTRSLAGIGEPVWAGRSSAELVECQAHESLINVAFADARGFTLLCPYDTSLLARGVVDEALRSHPVVHAADRRYDSPTYADPLPTFGPPLEDPEPDAVEIAFADGDLDAVRRVVGSAALEAGLGPRRVAELVLAVDEAAANSLEHGGGRGHLRLWWTDHGITVDVADRGVLASPLVGRAAPTREVSGERGLWLVHQLCDLVQIRSSATGTTVRMHVRLN